MQNEVRKEVAERGQAQRTIGDHIVTVHVQESPRGETRGALYVRLRPDLKDQKQA